MIPWLQSTVATFMIILSGIGATTIGVFVGIALGKRDSREWIALKDARIEQLERSINIYKETINIYKETTDYEQKMSRLQ